MTHNPQNPHIDVLDCILVLFKNKLEPTKYIGMTVIPKGIEWYSGVAKLRP